MKHVLSSIAGPATLLVTLAAVGAFGLAQAAPALSPTAPEHQHQHQASAPQAKQPDKAMHEQMVAAMKAEDARLEELLATVSTATGTEAKLDALTAVVAELVRQRKAMHEQMMQGGTMCPACSMMQGKESPAGAATRGETDTLSCGMMRSRRAPKL